LHAAGIGVRAVTRPAELVKAVRDGASPLVVSTSDAADQALHAVVPPQVRLVVLSPQLTDADVVRQIHEALAG
jgi:hypothetical protein